MGILKKELIRNVSALGTLPFFLIVISLLYLLNYTLFAIGLLFGILMGHILTYLIRFFYFKERPNPQKYGSLFEKIDASSFPSLHSIRATIFLVLGLKFVNHLFASFFFPTYTLVILYSRHLLKKHDYKDLIAGVFLGVFIGIFTIKITFYFFS